MKRHKNITAQINKSRKKRLIETAQRRRASNEIMRIILKHSPDFDSRMENIDLKKLSQLETEEY
jgi:hypothetical protein